MLGAAAVCAGLAASIVNGYTSEVRAQVGPLVPVAMARDDIPRGKLITPGNVERYIVQRQVPRRFVPSAVLRAPADALGLRSTVRIPGGMYVGSAQLASPANGDGQQLAPSSTARVVEVGVAGADGLQGLLRPGARVDVLVTSERAPGPPRTYLALQRVELVDFRAGDGDGLAEESSRSGAVAALRVGLRQAVLLVAAQNFARELRLVPRPPQDTRRLPASVVAASDLHP
jgi:pilus assembly protein CpaB